MEGKKISFGFSKLSKKPNVLSKNEEPKKVEIVECFEGKSMKIKGAVEKVKELLVIPIKDDQRNLLDRIKGTRAKQKETIKNSEEDIRPDSELTIEELAARELLRDAKNRLENNKSNKNEFVLPLKQDKPILEGEKEPTLDDYDAVPVSEYGMAILRGMGWKDGMGIGKNPSKTAAVSAPELRPKGLGLGASKIIKAETTKENIDKDGQELILKRGAYAKFVAGPQKGSYCEVLGLDDDSGRVIVKTPLNGQTVNISEFMLMPVTKQEYLSGYKVLNNAKYEEYKALSDKKLENMKQEVKKEASVENQKASKNNGKYNSGEQIAESSSSDKRDSFKEDKPFRRTDNYYEKNSRCTNSDNERRSRSKERSRSFKDKYQNKSSERENKNKHKKSKSKHRSRNRSSDDSSEDDYKSSKKQSRSQQKNTSSSSEDDYYKKKRKSKKNKCKSRHRRSSSSEDDREYNNRRR